MFNCKFSSPLKVIISGEHSVVYSKNAIAAAFSKFYECSLIEENDSNKKFLFDLFLFSERDSMKMDHALFFKIFETALTFDENTLNYESWKNKFVFSENLEESYIFAFVLNFVFSKLGLEKSIAGLKNYFQEKLIRISVKTELPNWTGVGSSASYLSCFSAALLHYFTYLKKIVFYIENHQTFQQFRDQVNFLAFKLEQIYHATPSGIDNTIINYGGMIKFNKINGIEQITQNFLGKYFKTLLINTKIRKDTKTAVNMVRKLTSDEETREFGVGIINDVGDITNEIIKILEKKENNEQDVILFEVLIKKNQKHLESLNLSHPKIALLMELSQKYNIVSKITGSGLGGCCLSFIRKDKKDDFEVFSNILKENDFGVYEIQIVEEGLKEIKELRLIQPKI